ncbi:hypothetical protein G5714_017981 [Onychostoma macrolepis]|uniref:Uncharacterized protein n=1 Tax=Onychostoma macrolepis TaxID=369639 RepID=A0A7J6C2N5_9TELE|nr:hypothetical protein G5714_017981 [Onychostoma macrolepis]
MSNVPELQLFPSDDELFSRPETPTVATRVSPERTDPSQETPSEHFSRKVQRSYKPRSRRLPSPPPSRSPVVSVPRPSLHSAAAISTIPPISKWSVNSLRQALSNSGLHFSRRSSKAQLYDLLSNYNNSSSIPTNSSTSKKKNQSSFTPVSPPVRRSEHVQRANPEAAAKTRGEKTTDARTSSSAGLSARPTTAAARNSSTAPPTLTNSLLQASSLPRQDASISTFFPVLPSIDNPCATSSQMVSFFSSPTQRADPSARLPSLAIPPPLLSFNVNSSHPLLQPSGSQIPPNVPPGAVPSARLPLQRTLSPLFPANPPLASAPPCHLGHQSLLGLPAQHPSSSSGPIHLPAHSLATAVLLPAPPQRRSSLLQNAWELSRSNRSVSFPFGRSGGSPSLNRCVIFHVINHGGSPVQTAVRALQSEQADWRYHVHLSLGRSGPSCPHVIQNPRFGRMLALRLSVHRGSFLFLRRGAGSLWTSVARFPFRTEDTLPHP